jgi:hypothetical protein
MNKNTEFYLNLCHPLDSSTCQSDVKMTIHGWSDVTAASGQSADERRVVLRDHVCQTHCHGETGNEWAFWNKKYEI